MIAAQNAPDNGRRTVADVKNTGMVSIVSPSKDSRYPRKPPVKLIDWAMLSLAVVSVGYLVWITFWHVSPETERTVFTIDYVVCGIFAVEFLWRWRRDGGGWRFPLRNWYEILGMVPVSSPFFRSFRLLRIVVVLARLGRATDRAVGDQITARLVNRFLGTIVDAIKRPVTVAVMDEVTSVLKVGNYTRNIARALGENREELDAMVVELIRNDPMTGKFRFIPFHDDIVRLVAETVQRILRQVLEDPRTDELVSDALRENIEQIRTTVHENYKQEKASGELSRHFKPADRPQESVSR